MSRLLHSAPPKHRGYERGALSGLLMSEMLKRSVEEEIVASCRRIKQSAFEQYSESYLLTP